MDDEDWDEPYDERSTKAFPLVFCELSVDISEGGNDELRACSSSRTVSAGTVPVMLSLDGFRKMERQPEVAGDAGERKDVEDALRDGAAGESGAIGMSQVHQVQRRKSLSQRRAGNRESRTETR